MSLIDRKVIQGLRGPMCLNEPSEAKFDCLRSFSGWLGQSSRQSV